MLSPFGLPFGDLTQQVQESIVPIPGINPKFYAVHISRGEGVFLEYPKALDVVLEVQTIGPSGPNFKSSSRIDQGRLNKWKTGARKISCKTGKTGGVSCR